MQKKCGFLRENFPHYTQLSSSDCGPTCLRMIASYYGKEYSAETLRKHSFISREGVFASAKTGN